jgi:hypothetical protein
MGATERFQRDSRRGPHAPAILYAVESIQVETPLSLAHRRPV